MNASTQIFSISEEEFNSYALDLFRYQAEQVAVYKMYLAHLQVDVTTIHEIQAIPFLPISFFKTSVILDQVKKDDMHMFQSSGTTGQIPSIHYVSDLALYEQSFLEGFSHFFGSPSRYVILALLPSYLERGHSSLVYMVQKLIHESGHIQSGFYLDQMEELADTIKQMEEQQQPVLLFGVTYALLDFAAQFPMPLQHTCLIETGGMKGRRRELPRMAVHDILKKAFGLKQIASEYGMTELLSQAYALQDGTFVCPPWMKVFMRDLYDPFDLRMTGRGALNIIDLANRHSCSFIATEDIGERFDDGSFLVHGRMQQAEIRGCNLLLTE